MMGTSRGHVFFLAFIRLAGTIWTGYGPCNAEAVPSTGHGEKALQINGIPSLRRPQKGIAMIRKPAESRC